MGSVALVFAGGDRPPPNAVGNLPTADLVIAADSGLEHAVALGFTVDLVVGDLDSVDPTALDTAVAARAHWSSATPRPRTRPISSSRCSPHAIAGAHR